MTKELVRFGEELSTALHPAIFVLICLAIGAMLFLDRRKAIAVFVFAAVVTPLGQRIVVLDQNLTMLRVLLFAGWLRMLPVFWHQSGQKRLRGGGIDVAMLIWSLCATVSFTLLWMDMSALMNRIGFIMINIVGCYFLLRIAIRDRNDGIYAVGGLAVASIVVATAVSYEAMTGWNLFGMLGGVSELSAVRDGSVRAQGPFAHSILAGTFGATLVPLLMWLRAQGGRARSLAAIAILSVPLLIVSSHSSTALLAGMGGIGALFLWPLRRRMRLIRFVTIGTLIALHLVMNAPVWALIGRIDLTGSSSSYHRYMLIDQFLRRFSEWWLLGVESTNGWGFDMWDTSNWYVEMGTTGGLATLIAFIAILWASFRAIGRCGKAAGHAEPEREWQMWCLASALFAHAFAFFGIAYFDQSVVAWLVPLAIVAGCVDTLGADGAVAPVRIGERGNRSFIQRVGHGAEFSRRAGQRTART